ncbi:MAG: YbhB/YbcL family Raf kinase inhibitor-like protein [Thermoguttaceae bacterium]
MKPISSLTVLPRIGLALAVAAMVSPAGYGEGVKHMAIQVTSSAFVQGQPIPKKYTGEGADVSPPLAWANVPAGAKELVLICDDPDAPVAEPWVHWVIYKIPATVTSLPEGVARKDKPSDPAGAVQGKNSWPAGENIGYRGPMPPPGHGVHHYHFKVYALDTTVDAAPGLDKKAVLAKIRGHVLAEGELMGTYERKK